MELTDRNLVVTGAGSGIGAALARRFAQEPPRARVQADVGGEEDIHGLVERAREAGGPVALFFSNAGIPGPDGGPPEAPDEEWDRAWRVNVMAHVWAARVLLPQMIDRGEGYLLSTA